jgi:hypothetical protein
MVVFWVQDLLFVSKIREVARTLGVEAKSVRDADALAAAASNATLVVLDLRLPTALPALERLAGTPVKKVGFIDHERTDVMERARELGCIALAKGKFSTELPTLMGLA